MTEVDDMPVRGGCMADVAGLIGNNMGIVFAWRLYAIMTTRTGTRYHFTVIETNHTPVLSRGMTGIALCGGLYMIRILSGLCNTIMTTGATAKHLLSMDKVNHQPGVGRGMTDLARFTGWHMTDRLSDCTDPVVAALAISADSGVREVIHSPAVGGVAEIAGLIGQNMTGRFTRGAGAVMTGFTAAGSNGRMIEKDQ